MQSADRLGESLLWWARALQLAPADSNLARTAYCGVYQVIKQIYRKKFPGFPVAETGIFNIGCLLRPEEWPLYLSIAAHFDESIGQPESAGQLYQKAVRESGGGLREKLDMERFEKAYGDTTSI